MHACAQAARLICSIKEVVIPLPPDSVRQQPVHCVAGWTTWLKVVPKCGLTPETSASSRHWLPAQDCNVGGGCGGKVTASDGVTDVDSVNGGIVETVLVSIDEVVSVAVVLVTGADCGVSARLRKHPHPGAAFARTPAFPNRKQRAAEIGVGHSYSKAAHVGTCAQYCAHSAKLMCNMNVVRAAVSFGAAIQHPVHSVSGSTTRSNVVFKGGSNEETSANSMQ